MPTPLSDNDRAALHEAAELVKTVVERHPHEVTSQIILVMQALIHDVDLITWMLGAAS